MELVRKRMHRRDKLSILSRAIPKGHVRCLDCSFHCLSRLRTRWITGQEAERARGAPLRHGKRNG